jgi:hypothetical protein
LSVTRGAIATISQHQVLRWHAGAVTLLVLAHAILQIATAYADHSPLHNLAQLFHLDREGNLPTAFQGFALLASALLLFTIARHTRARWEGRRWLIVTLAVIYMATDEVASLHERAASVVRLISGASGEDSYIGWILLLGPVALALALYLLPMLRVLPLRISIGLAAVGIIYFSGAVGLELVAWLVRDEQGFAGTPYLIATTFEEAFEMAATVLLIQVLLAYLRERGWALTIAARE